MYLKVIILLQMGLKDKLALTRSNIEYTRPQQLPIQVAFPILRGDLTSNKLKPNDDSRRVFLKYNQRIELMVYLPNKFSKFTADDMAEFATDNLYLVSRGMLASEKVNLDILTKDEIDAEDGLVIFDCKFI